MKNLLIGVTAIFMAIPAILFAQPNEKQPLVGMWELKFSQNGTAAQPPRVGLEIFGEDGACTTIVGTAIEKSTPVLQALADELGTGQGRWVQIGEREFQVTFYSPLLKSGVVSGFQRKKSTMLMSETGNEWTANAQADFLDANGNVVFSDSVEAQGRRLENPGSAGNFPEKNRVVGAWKLTMFQTGQGLPPLLGLAIYGGDGTFFTTVGNPIKTETNPSLRRLADTLGAGYGRWIQTGEKEMRMTFYFPLLKEGVINGFSRVDSTVVLTESGDDFSAQSRTEFLDPDLKVLLTVASEGKGTRLETPDQP
jgi:hypothetical protein